jgi:hypothetical protein
MTDLERKLAETLREQAGGVTPNLDAAWAEQQRRQRRPRTARRRLTLVVAPLAAVLVVLTSVLLATQLQTAAPTAPAAPANTPGTVPLAKLVYRPMSELQVTGTPIALRDFSGQTDAWTSYAFSAVVAGTPQFCVGAVPAGKPLDPAQPQFGTKSPVCGEEVAGGTFVAGYVAETGGPLPAGLAVYLTVPAVADLRVYTASGDLTLARLVGRFFGDQVFLADLGTSGAPTRFEVHKGAAVESGRFS